MLIPTTRCMLPVRIVAVFSAALLSTTAVTAWEPGSVGEEFQVNTYTTGLQFVPSVAVAPDRSFVVVWQSDGSAGSDGSGSSIQGRRYDSDGGPLDAGFQVNTVTTGFQIDPRVATADDGSFVVVWWSETSSGDDTSASVQARRYNSDGSAATDDFQVNTSTTSYQRQPAVAMAADSSFIVAWHSLASTGTDTDTYSIAARRYASDGTAAGDDFQVNTYTTGGQFGASVAMSDDGSFVIAWFSTDDDGADTDSTSVHARRYDSSGLPLADSFGVNTYTTGSQASPEISLLPNGDFVVVWQGPEIVARRFSSAGGALTGELQVNTYTTGSQSEGKIAAGPDGGFVVVWTSDGSDGPDTSSSSVQARCYDASNSPGDAFLVNTYTTSIQANPAVAVGPSGNMVAVWTSVGSATGDDDGSIQAQRYGLIFIDGFESGDTSAW